MLEKQVELHGASLAFDKLCDSGKLLGLSELQLSDL